MMMNRQQIAAVGFGLYCAAKNGRQRHIDTDIEFVTKAPATRSETRDKTNAHYSRGQIMKIPVKACPQLLPKTATLYL